MSQCFHLLLGEVVIVKEESGPTSSGNAKQLPGEIQGVKTTTFYQWKYIHHFTVLEEGVQNVWACCKQQTNLKC